MRDLRKSTKTRVMDSYYELRRACLCGPCGCNCSCGDPTTLYYLYISYPISGNSGEVAGGYATTMTM